MRILNSLLGGFVEIVLYPFRSLPPIVGLVVVSVITASGMLLVFKVTSNQEGVQKVKRQISAGVFEIRLFNDDPRSVLRAQWDILRHTVRYLRLNLVPLAWMIVPLVLVIIHLQFHYGYEGLEVDRATIVKVKLTDSFAQPEPDLSLEHSPGIRVESPMLWIPTEREADWRVSATEPGKHELHVRVGDTVLEKSLRVSESIVRRSPIRPSGFWGQVVYPVEAPLRSDGPVESIAIAYPERRIDVLGLGVHWIVVFFILAMVLAFALQRPFKVSI